MNKITENFQKIHLPVKAWVLRQSIASHYDRYVEAYDFDRKGRPINAHPLTEEETIQLAQSLASSEQLKKKNFLHYKGLLPESVLRVQSGHDSYVIWYTRPMRKFLYFSPDLGIPNGEATIPCLLWKAHRSELRLFALNEPIGRPNLDTALFHAPFFNINLNGRVCMGTISTDIPEDCELSVFIEKWQEYFFNSYFSHLIEGHQPTLKNTVRLWKNLCSGKVTPFPYEQLKQSTITVKDLLS
ncbi:PRTRC system protein B [Olivibacter jilunii]|uniref:PRTRC system protein B n=1 Tax=Olivibacter jilunii TaxID=985016 RepID=UPI0010309DDA|nr:PRTRC system protein B [Olivibacter jilunii]